MDWQREFKKRSIIVNLFAVLVAAILMEVVWGLAAGIVGGVAISRDPEFQNRVTAFMKDRGVDVKASPDKAKAAYNQLSPQDKKNLDDMTRDVLKGANWFAVALSVSVIVYGLTGFLGGFFARAWLLTAGLPVWSLLTNNPVVRFEWVVGLPLFEKSIVFLLPLAACSLTAFFGAGVGKKRAERKMAAAS
jgi:hypothetical protein